MAFRIVPAILSGGSGTRLWPVSTEDKPKQFHALIGGRTLFEDTLARVSQDTDDIAFAPPIVICNAGHEALVEARLAAMGVSPAAIVLEPCGRNTAAAAAIAAAIAQEVAPGALALLLPADHVVGDVAAFHAAVARAAAHAREHIVTFGIEPDRPATGYGYIKRGAALGAGVHHVAAFKEKPKEPLARAYLNEGGYSWNAGMFLFAPELLLEEFAAAADIRDAALATLEAARRDGVKIHLDEAAFKQVRSQPLDIAVMEQTQRAAVAPCEIGWADVGAWDEVWRLSPRDGAGNAISGPAAVSDGANNLVRSEGPKICTAGVDDLIVIATREAVIVLPRARAQEVGALLERAKNLR